MRVVVLMTEMGRVPIDPAELVALLRAELPGLIAVYGFGSRWREQATADSDLDLAVLVEASADPVTLWQLAQRIADRVGMEVDLVDLRGASTVMQHQVITTGRQLWARQPEAGVFEGFVMSEKLALDAARAALLADIGRDGRVHAR